MKGVNLGVAPVLQNKDQACFGTLGTFGIFTTAKDPNAVAKWIQFMSQPENQAFYNTVSGFVPPRASAFKLWRVDPLVKEFATVASPSIRADRDTYYYYNQNAVLVLPSLQEAILHKKTAKQAMDEAAKAMDQYIAQITGQ
jgi:ABC-type glycerol-3-phosphate transport system substrate-binding protein